MACCRRVALRLGARIRGSPSGEARYRTRPQRRSFAGILGLCRDIIESTPQNGQPSSCPGPNDIEPVLCSGQKANVTKRLRDAATGGQVSGFHRPHFPPRIFTAGKVFFDRGGPMLAEIRTTVARLLHSGGPSRSRETFIVSIKSVNKPQRRAETGHHRSKQG